MTDIGLSRSARRVCVIARLQRKVGDDCLLELRWMYDRRDLSEVRRDLAAWLAKWSRKYPKLTSWVEDNIEETLTYFRVPLAHRKHMKSTNSLERLNEEIRRLPMSFGSFPMPTVAFGSFGRSA